jgi:archaellum component FlaF (FlaF/FlaG flagellin family)
LQYRMGGKNGTTLVLHEPSKVLLDGEQLKVDSAKVTGAYYEVQKPIASFAGKHTISFTDLNKKEYNEEFEFAPFTIEPNVPATMNRGDLVFTFKGLEAVDVLSVTLTDTSFQSTDITNDIDTVRNGRLVISASRLSALVNGPINVQFYKEAEKPIKSATKEGGKLYIRYGVKREFELKDAVKL